MSMFGIRKSRRHANRHPGPEMILFLDTEFTDLVIEPRLLSVGIVAAAPTAGEFYAEVTDRRRIGAASWFALDVVLPQFGKVAQASCTYATLGARLCDYMARLTAALGPDEVVEIAFSYDLDWELAERAMREGDAERQGAVIRKMSPQNVYDSVGFGAGKRAAEAYFAGESDALISRHHALCDARALRIAYEAAEKPIGAMVRVPLTQSAAARPGAATPALLTAMR